MLAMFGHSLSLSLSVSQSIMCVVLWEKKFQIVRRLGSLVRVFTYMLCMGLFMLLNRYNNAICCFKFIFNSFFIYSFFEKKKKRIKSFVKFKKYVFIISRDFTVKCIYLAFIFSSHLIVYT